MTPALPKGPVALFVDVDGTLIDIAPRPNAVVVPPPLKASLLQLEARLGGALALVSGRTIADLDGLFAPLRLRASGVHGAELRAEPGDAPAPQAANRLPDATVRSIRAAAAAHAGTLVEDKGYSVAIHYRANPSAGDALRRALDDLVAADGPGLQVLPGHMVFEVKRAGINKGVAITALMARPPFSGRRPVFIGDDVTDLPGFDAVLAVGGLAFSVSTPRPNLSGHFIDPEAVRTWLAGLAETGG